MIEFCHMLVLGGGHICYTDLLQLSVFKFFPSLKKSSIQYGQHSARGVKVCRVYIIEQVTFVSGGSREKGSIRQKLRDSNSDPGNIQAEKILQDQNSRAIGCDQIRRHGGKQWHMRLGGQKGAGQTEPETHT